MPTLCQALAHVVFGRAVLESVWPRGWVGITWVCAGLEGCRPQEGCRLVGEPREHSEASWGGLL